MDDCRMLIDFTDITPTRQHLQKLKDIKHELIGNEKRPYFDKGLIETIMPFVSTATSDHQVLYECIAILNSFLIQFSEAIEVFHVYAS